MANMSKAEKEATRLRKKEERRQAAGEIMEGRFRTALGFAGAYVGTQILPSVAPSLPAGAQGTIDIALAGIGGWFALTDDGPLGDYALGAAMVGLTQTLDNAGTKIQEWLNS